MYLTVVYRGPAGEEQDAVLYGSKDLFEPDPVDVGNMTDYDCFGPDPFHVSDFSAWPPFDFNNPDPQTNPQPRDLTQPKDGFPELFGPQDELSDVYMKISSLQAPQFASPSLFDYKVPQRLARNAPSSCASSCCRTGPTTSCPGAWGRWWSAGSCPTRRSSTPSSPPCPRPTSTT